MHDLFPENFTGTTNSKSITDNTSQAKYHESLTAFVNTLFPVTRPHHIYPTTLVIITVIDNLKNIIIFICFFFRGKFQKLPKCISVKVSKSLGRIIVPWSDIEFHEKALSFGDLLSCTKASRFSVIEVSDNLKQAKLLKTFIGSKPDVLIVSGSDKCIIAVCSQFSICIKLSVECFELICC